MFNVKFTNLKKPLLAVTLLKTTPVVMGKTGSGKEGSGEESGKSQLGVHKLILEETPGQNAIICTLPEASLLTGESASQGQWMSSDLIVAVDPFNHSFFEIIFSVREMLPHDEDHMLLLVYSQKLTPSPDIATPHSENKFQLDLNTLELLGLYNIPAQQLLVQPSTRIGVAKPRPRSIVSFGVNLDTLSLRYYMKNKESIYLQAALLKRSDFDAGNFETMILSEVDVISFVEWECPVVQQEVVETTELANEQ
jgi:hypothetical protein